MIFFFLTGLEIAAGISLWQAIAISAALSAAQFALNYALRPKPKPLERGKLSGDTQIQDSRYGLMIPESAGGLNENSLVTGGTRQAGNIIWASEIRKVVTSEEVGGKGAPKQEVKTTQYYQDIAISWGRGRKRLLKLWAGAKLVLDLTESGTVTGVYDDTVPDDEDWVIEDPPDPTATYINPRERYNKQGNFGPIAVYTLTIQGSGAVRHYEGASDQPVDSLIQADVDGRLGAASAPAYRGTAYTVIENLNLSDFGGFMPNFTALLVDLDIHSLSHLVQDFATRVGLATTDLALSAASGANLRGVLMTNIQTPRTTLEALARIYNFEFSEVNGSLSAVQRGTKAPVVIDLDYVGARQGRQSGGGDVPDLLQIRVKDTPQIPREVRVTHYDPSRDFQNNTQSSPIRDVSRASRVDTLEYPVTLTADEARNLAARELYAADVEATAYQFTLPWKYAYLAPTDVLSITAANGREHRIRLLQITGGVPGVIECVGVAEDPAAFSQSVSGAAGDGQGTTSVAYPSSTVLQLIDVALLREGDDVGGVYMAGAPLDANGAWGGATIYRDKGNGDEKIETLTSQGVMGVAYTALQAATDATTWDTASFVEVDLYAGILENKTELQVLNGANAILIGSEIIQFTTAAQQSGYARRWRLSNLLRGRKGTDYAMSGHTVGERCVLLNDALKFVPIDLSERSIERTFKAVTSGQSLAEVNAWAFTYSANNLKPLSVVDVAGTRDGSNNLTLTWKRRTRASGQWLDSADVPLFEESESYEIDVMSGATVKRTITATTQTASYTAAMATTDSLAPAGPVTFRIYQLSARVGRGFVREAAI